MNTVDTHVDREGYTHIEVCLDTPNRVEVARFFSAIPPIANLSNVLSVDHRTEESGFEFWHIKGV